MNVGASWRACLGSLLVVAALAWAALALANAVTLILPKQIAGVRYFKVKQTTIGTTICVKGWTATSSEIRWSSS
jgi:hypothetical protein